MVWREDVADIAESADELIEGSGFDPPEVSFELCECHFDGVEVGGIGGKIEQPTTVCLQNLSGPRALVGGKIVENDDSARFQSRYKLGLV